MFLNTPNNVLRLERMIDSIKNANTTLSFRSLVGILAYRFPHLEG